MYLDASRGMLTRWSPFAIPVYFRKRREYNTSQISRRSHPAKAIRIRDEATDAANWIQSKMLA